MTPHDWTIEQVSGVWRLYHDYSIREDNEIARFKTQEEAERIRALGRAAYNAIDALAERWVKVNCTPAEERTIRELNDALQSITP